MEKLLLTRMRQSWMSFSFAPSNMGVEILKPRALAARPTVLVLDEALSSLDVSLQAGMADLLRKEARDMACLFITHDLQLASRVCAKILVLDGGRITDDLATRDVFSGSATLSPRLESLLENTIVFRSDFEG